MSSTAATTSLFHEVCASSQHYIENAERIEEEERTVLQNKRETACKAALAEITQNVEHTIKTAAGTGRKVRDKYLPRTQCCIYRWTRDDASTGAGSELTSQNKFGDFYLLDLLRRQGLIHKLQDWFDEHHQREPVPCEGDAKDQGKDQGEDGETTGRKGPRPVPPTRAFKVYWNPIRNKEGQFGIFVNWDRDSWEQVSQHLRSGAHPNKGKGKSNNTNANTNNKGKSMGPRQKRLRQDRNAPKQGRTDTTGTVTPPPPVQVPVPAPTNCDGVSVAHSFHPSI